MNDRIWLENSQGGLIMTSFEAIPHARHVFYSQLINCSAQLNVVDT